MLVRRWPIVCDAGPILNQHRVFANLHLILFSKFLQALLHNVVLRFIHRIKTEQMETESKNIYILLVSLVASKFYFKIKYVEIPCGVNVTVKYFIWLCINNINI